MTGFQMGPTHVRILVEAPAALVGGAAVNTQKQLVFVLDVSGSMGSYFGQVYKETGRRGGVEE